MKLDGKQIAEEIYEELRGRRSLFNKPITLGIVVGGANPVIEQFVRIKSRAAERLSIDIVRVNLSDTADTQKTIDAVKELAERTDSVIIQLPLPTNLDTDAILSAIPAEKDVDAINPSIPEDKHPVFAPVALAVVELLKRGGVEIEGKRAVVVGAGRLVGAPSAMLLKRLGASVSIFSLEEGSIVDLKDADIAVLGAGKPGFIKPEHLKQGVALIDAGASEQAGVVVGDADPACEAITSVFSPVPGGVGPVAVAMIFKNLFDLIEKSGK